MKRILNAHTHIGRFDWKKETVTLWSDFPTIDTCYLKPTKKSRTKNPSTPKQ